MYSAKKGEYENLFKELSLLGFMRFLVDGKIYMADEVPKLDKNIKHSIDVIIDRLTIEEKNRDRITDSIQTAINVSKSTVKISSQEKKEIFSTLFACPDCSYSLEEVEPRLFSFNSPSGACNHCDGLGTKYFFDEEKVIINSDISINAGAIRGWDKNNLLFIESMSSLAAFYDFSLSKPFNTIAKEKQKIILYGTEEKSLFILLIKKGLKKVEYKLLRESSPLWSDAIFKQTQWLSKCHSQDTEA